MASTAIKHHPSRLRWMENLKRGNGARFLPGDQRASLLLSSFLPPWRCLAFVQTLAESIYSTFRPHTTHSMQYVADSTRALAHQLTRTHVPAKTRRQRSGLRSWRYLRERPQRSEGKSRQWQAKAWFRGWTDPHNQALPQTRLRQRVRPLLLLRVFVVC